MPTPSSAADWCEYFTSNGGRLLPLPWDRGPTATPAELAAVGKSLARFQLGESSEGRSLLAAAEEHAAATGDPAYRTAIRLFMAEEHRHSRDLGRYLEAAGVPLLRRHWADGVFRRLRKGAGLETVLTVLLTAEIVAKVYYRAVRAATGCPLLRAVCTQLLRDEAMHVRFHLERLALLRTGRSRWRVAVTAARWRVLFAGTCGVVWATHAAALRAGGYDRRRFLTAAWAEFAKGERLIAGTRVPDEGRRTPSNPADTRLFARPSRE